MGCQNLKPKEVVGSMMSTEANKTVVRRISEEVVLQGKKDVIDELLAPNFVYHGPGGFPDMGRDGFVQFFDGWRAAFPDATITFEDFVAEGDKVAVRYTTRATHKGEFNGIPATGKRVTVQGLFIRRVEDGKVAEEWDFTDLLGMMKQLGVVP